MCLSVWVSVNTITPEPEISNGRHLEFRRKSYFVPKLLPERFQSRDIHVYSIAVSIASPTSVSIVKPKYHYADFPVTSVTIRRQTRDVPLICRRRRRFLRVLSRTSPIAPFPRRKRAGCRLVTGIFQPSRHVAIFETSKLCRDFPVT